MGVTRYIDKRIQTCPMCAESTYTRTRYFEWIGMITEERLEICLKCAKREIGSAKKQQIKLKKMYE